MLILLSRMQNSRGLYLSHDLIEINFFIDKDTIKHVRRPNEYLDKSGIICNAATNMVTNYSHSTTEISALTSPNCPVINERNGNKCKIPIGINLMNNNECFQIANSKSDVMKDVSNGNEW